MMITKERIVALVEEKIAGTELFIVDVKVNSGNKIIVHLDNEKGLPIDSCVAVSRHIEQNLDRELEDFELEVSSPGLGQPLKVFRQYLKYKGKQVEVITNDGQKTIGNMVEVDEDGIRLETKKKLSVAEKKSKQNTITQSFLTFKQIKETKIVISFK